MRLTPAAGIRALKRSLYRPRKQSRRAERRVIRDFHKLYYYSRERTWKDNTFWLNVPVAKCPLDLWVYQEIICETKPDLIIETGTAYGGSALYLASICDLVDRGRIVTIDIRELAGRPNHERINYLQGSSTSEEIVTEVKDLIRADDRVMVILDSDHQEQHVLDELGIYSSLVSVGCYLVVEDTNLNGHPVLPLYGAGPMEAVEKFRNERPDFVDDQLKEKFLMTFNPKGYLRHTSAGGRTS
jgi:cephalosporin hydroxylase